MQQYRSFIELFINKEYCTLPFAEALLIWLSWVEQVLTCQFSTIISSQALTVVLWTGVGSKPVPILTTIRVLPTP